MIETHKRQLERWQSKLGISNYGIAWIAFFKGMIFGVLVITFLSLNDIEKEFKRCLSLK